MSLVFRSSIPEQFAIIGQDSDGNRRIATATKVDSQQTRWDLKLTHPSGRNWSGSFNGPNVLDALGELMSSKTIDYRQEKARGHRPEQPLFDHNRRLSDDDSITPIVPRR
jgi:hypothetical protein